MRELDLDAEHRPNCDETGCETECQVPTHEALVAALREARALITKLEADAEGFLKDVAGLIGERDDAKAAAGQMRAALEHHRIRHHVEPTADDPCTQPNCGACHCTAALSTDTDRGWVSPEAHAEVVRERDEARALAGNHWRDSYMKVADAIASESTSSDDLAAKARATRARAEKAEATARKLWEAFELMDCDGERAFYLKDVGRTPEDVAVLALCERHGFGAVIDSACRQWFLRDSLGAFVSGPCAGTVRLLRAALKGGTR